MALGRRGAGARRRRRRGAAPLRGGDAGRELAGDGPPARRGVHEPLAGTDLTARFGADGSLSGSAGCNTYKSSYTTEKHTIEIAAPAATRKACADPAGVMEQESAYLALLPTAVSYRLDGNVLELLAADGTRLVTYALSS